MSNYKKHAAREFEAAGWTKDGKFDCEMQARICNHVLELLDTFASEGHSGSSAPYALRLFSQLAKFEPIIPLTGEDSEWNESGDMGYQNNRCSHVFKNSNGTSYDIQAIVFEDDDGCSFTGFESRQPVTFPYTPKTKYVSDKERHKYREGAKKC